MALLTKRDEAKRYLLSRCAQNDFTALEYQVMLGALKIAKSGFWIGPFITELLSEYEAGERASVGQVMVKLAESIDAFERAAAVDPKALSRFTGKQSQKTHEQSAAGSAGEGVLQ